MTFSICMAYPEESFCQVLTYCLEREGWQVKVAEKSDCIDQTNDYPDLWIIDADGEKGFNMVHTVKAKANHVPIILTSDREKVIDRVLALELGCEDLVVKPFLPREMVLRVQRIIENSSKPRSNDSANLVTMQGLLIYLDSRTVMSEGNPVLLTTKEFDLLLFFLGQKGVALSRAEILRTVWGTSYTGSDRVVDDLIRRLRCKLSGFQIETIYGHGYRVNE